MYNESYIIRYWRAGYRYVLYTDRKISAKIENSLNIFDGVEGKSYIIEMSTMYAFPFT